MRTIISIDRDILGGTKSRTFEGLCLKWTIYNIGDMWKCLLSLTSGIGESCPSLSNVGRILRCRIKKLSASKMCSHGGDSWLIFIGLAMCFGEKELPI